VEIISELFRFPKLLSALESSLIPLASRTERFLNQLYQAFNPNFPTDLRKMVLSYLADLSHTDLSVRFVFLNPFSASSYSLASLHVSPLQHQKAIQELQSVLQSFKQGDVLPPLNFSRSNPLPVDEDEEHWEAL
jgi:hypothetical protein